MTYRLAGQAGERAAASVERGVAGIAGSTALVVLGMHRSGTSALTGMLHHLGVALGERLMPARPTIRAAIGSTARSSPSTSDLMAALGWAWDDIRSLPAGFERTARRAARRELSPSLHRDFAGAPLWG
jgi:hypothetical protein